MTLPILYSFRRCPYAMRARLAIDTAGIPVELREVVLREKPTAFLAASPSATVPCLEYAGGVIDESLEIMIWALQQNDPENWLNVPAFGHDLITQTDGAFKGALDRYKYASRYDDVDVLENRKIAAGFIQELETLLGGKPYLFGDAPRLPDMAILPFVRQFAHVDLAWFSKQTWAGVQTWLDTFKTSSRFKRIMPKFSQWVAGEPPVYFPQQ